MATTLLLRIPSTPGGVLLGQALKYVLDGITAGTFKPPVEATAYHDNQEILFIGRGKNDLEALRFREVTAAMFPLTLDIKHAGGTKQIPIKRHP